MLCGTGSAPRSTSAPRSRSGSARRRSARPTRWRSAPGPCRPARRLLGDELAFGSTLPDGFGVALPDGAGVALPDGAGVALALGAGAAAMPLPSVALRTLRKRSSAALPTSVRSRF